MTIGLLFTTGAGEYFLTLFDTYGAMGLTLIALTEIIAVMYVYGHARFTDDIEEMTGIRPGFYWQICWRFVAPVLLAVILVSSIITQAIKTPTYIAWNGTEVRCGMLKLKLILSSLFICRYPAFYFCEITFSILVFQAKAESKVYPPSAITLAFILALASVVPIIVVAVLR